LTVSTAPFYRFDERSPAGREGLLAGAAAEKDYEAFGEV
jgi:hypothetical protein